MINFSGLSSNRSVGKLLRYALRFVPSSAVVRVIQGRLRGARWVVGAGTHGCWLGSYEADKQGVFVRVVRPHATVVDVGANVGFYSLLASRLVGPAGVVVAVEPDPRNVHFLQRHIALNHATNVVVIAAAAGDRSGSARFRAGPNRSMGRLSDGGEVEVELTTLDQIRGTLGGRRVDVMKLDVEGAEGMVLAGATELLRQDRPIILLATHGEQERADCLSLLRECEYAVTPLSVGENPDDALEFIAHPRSNAERYRVSQRPG